MCCPRTSDDSGGGTGPQAWPVGLLPIVEAAGLRPVRRRGGAQREAPLAIDGDPPAPRGRRSATAVAISSTKPGVGLWIDLDAPHDISSVTVTALEGGWSGQIYVADQPGNTLDAWGHRAHGRQRPRRHPFAVNARGQYVLVWCTQLPPANKLQIGDIKVEGR